MNQEKIGEFIAKCRKEKKLTQQELGDKLYVSDKTISSWESGRTLPDINTIVDIIIKPIFIISNSPLTVSLNIRFRFKKGIIEYNGVVLRFIKYEIKPGNITIILIGANALWASLKFFDLDAIAIVKPLTKNENNIIIKISINNVGTLNTIL